MDRIGFLKYPKIFCASCLSRPKFDGPIQRAGKGRPNLIVVIVVVQGRQLEGVGQAGAAAACGGVAVAQRLCGCVRRWWRGCAAAACGSGCAAACGERAAACGNGAAAGGGIAAAEGCCGDSNQQVVGIAIC